MLTIAAIRRQIAVANALLADDQRNVDLTRDRQVRGLRLAQPRFGLRRALFLLPPQSAEQVGIETDPAAHGIEMEFGRTRNAEARWIEPECG